MEKRKSKIKFILDILMTVILFLFLMGGLIKALFFNREVNYYENRPCNRFSNVKSLNEFLNSEAQNKIELAFADQIPLSITMKKSVNYLTSSINNGYVDFVAKNFFRGKYIAVNGGLYKIGGYDNIVYGFGNIEPAKEILSRKLDNYGTVIRQHPDIKFLIYYIEKDSDINFETNQKAGYYEFMNSNIKENNLIVDRFSINSFDEYRDLFYETDHHWNYKGSYKGYCQILSILLPNEKPLEPVKTINTKLRFSGSKARTAGTTQSEIFEAYDFNLPEHKTYIDGNLREYGQEELYKNKEISSISYGEYYGGDCGEVIFDYNQPEKENLLIIGESHDNAIIKILASNFNKTYAIDLRAYSIELGKEFKFNEYIKDKNISKVLFCGSASFYASDVFLIEE